MPAWGVGLLPLDTRSRTSPAIPPARGDVRRTRPTITPAGASGSHRRKRHRELAWDRARAGGRSAPAAKCFIEDGPGDRTRVGLHPVDAPEDHVRAGERQAPSGGHAAEDAAGDSRPRAGKSGSCRRTAFEDEPGDAVCAGACVRRMCPRITGGMGTGGTATLGWLDII